MRAGGLQGLNLPGLGLLYGISSMDLILDVLSEHNENVHFTFH